MLEDRFLKRLSKIARKGLRGWPQLSRTASKGAAEILLQFEADARYGCGANRSVDERHFVAITAERLETEGIDLGAAETQCSRYVQAEEVAAMRPKRRTRPAAPF
jgi:hypothetical protein